MLGPYSEVGARLVERGYCALPIIPGSKRPGHLRGGEWVGLPEWQSRWLSREVSRFELEHWSASDAGVGILCGPGSGDTVCFDIDTDDAEVRQAILSCLPYTPVRKRGQKGEGLFFHGPGIPSQSFNSYDAAGKRTGRLLDIIANGRQTVVPPSLHPDTGKPYSWTGEEALDAVDPKDLPEVGSDVIVALQAALRPFGYLPDPPRSASISNSHDDETPHRTLNNAALANLSAWVPKLGLYKLKSYHGGYRAVASWRPSHTGRQLEKRQPNLKIVPDGIRDFHDDRSYTPIDLVIEASQCDADTAFAQLAQWIGWAPQEPIILAEPTSPPKGEAATITMNGVSADPAVTITVNGVTADAETGEIAKPNVEAGPILALPPPERRFSEFKLRDLSLIPRRRWIYGHHYIRKFISASVAPGGVGKSSLTIVEALAIASGRPLLGITPNERGRVWLWNGEDPREEMERRIAAACKHYEITNEDIEGRLFVDSGRDSEIIVARTNRHETTIVHPVVDGLSKAIARHKIDVVVIDPFVSSHRVSENDNMAIDMVAKAWAGIADSCFCSVELVHHARKTGGMEVAVEDARGASALLSAARSARTLNGMSEAEAEHCQIQLKRVYFKVDNGKANLALPPEKSSWYHLVSVPLGNGDGGMLDNGDKVGVVTAWEWPEIVDENLSDPQIKEIQGRIGPIGQWREDIRSAQWAGLVIADVLGLDSGNKGVRESLKKMLRELIKEGFLEIKAGQDGERKTKNFVVCAS